MRLRLISDGTPAGTKVVDEDGRQVELVTFYQLQRPEADGPQMLSLTVIVDDPPRQKPRTLLP